MGLHASKQKADITGSPKDKKVKRRKSKKEATVNGDAGIEAITQENEDATVEKPAGEINGEEKAKSVKENESQSPAEQATAVDEDSATGSGGVTAPASPDTLQSISASTDEDRLKPETSKQELSSVSGEEVSAESKPEGMTKESEETEDANTSNDKESAQVIDTQDEKLQISQSVSNDSEQCQNADKLSPKVESSDVNEDTKQVVSKVDNVTVTFKWEHGGKDVKIFGSFDEWKNPLPLMEKDGIFVLSTDLAVGDHHYKYQVDGEWIVDKNKPAVEIDDHGMVNVISVSVTDTKE